MDRVDESATVDGAAIARLRGTRTGPAVGAVRLPDGPALVLDIETLVATLV